MKRLLFVEASPRGEASVSTSLAEHFLAALQTHPQRWEVDRLRLWTEALPEFTGAALNAKYARLAGRGHSGEETSAWRSIEALVDRLDRSDALLIATPMWNFGIPYKLKHWFDLVTQPGLSFSFDPASGYRPLLAARPVLVLLASSGDYSQGPSWGRPDLASGYLTAALGFIGLPSPEIILCGPTAGDPAKQAAAREAAAARLTALAARFGRPA